MSAPTADNATEAWSTTAQDGSQDGSATGGVGGSRMASRNESAARARAWVYANNVAGWRARASDWGASQRAAQPETRMRAHIEIIAAPLNTAAPPAPNQDATSYGDGMLDELEELCQTSKTQQQK
ncbi:hypothetical protein BR93DRAFT_940828 [Coniochaeta sp. PMI_546]|nr:hypothetical protein BR93DRAFT_940828 [Coniochaeta sp. PMI_546]